MPNYVVIFIETEEWAGRAIERDKKKLNTLWLYYCDFAKRFVKDWLEILMTIFLFNFYPLDLDPSGACLGSGSEYYADALSLNTIFSGSDGLTFYNIEYELSMTKELVFVQTRTILLS